MFPLVLHPPLFWGCVVLYLRSQKGGCCSISNDMSCFYGKFWINTLLSILVQLLLYILKCNYFGITTFKFFVKIINIPDEELFSETYIGCTASYLVLIIWCCRWFVSPSEAVYCYICGRRRVAVARYRMICFVLPFTVHSVGVSALMQLCKKLRLIKHNQNTSKQCKYITRMGLS